MNSRIRKYADSSHQVFRVLEQVSLDTSGTLVDIGGSTGYVAAAFKGLYPEWRVLNLDISAAAVRTGRSLFPAIDHHVVDITAEERPLKNVSADIVLVSAVLSMVPRENLLTAVAHIDHLVATGGLLIVYDYLSVLPRANANKHHPGQFVFKVDYSEIFLSSNLYRRQSVVSATLGSQYASEGDLSDIDDNRVTLSILRKVDPLVSHVTTTPNSR